MRNHTIEIADKTGQIFRLRVSTPSNGTKVWGGITGTDPYPLGNWRSLDKGFIRHHHGNIHFRRTYNSKDLTTNDIYLSDSSDKQRGIEIFEYEDWTGVNDVGTGIVYQSWVLNMSVGKFSWAIID